jgi:iron complex outermembrane recepter protein
MHLRFIPLLFAVFIFASEAWAQHVVQGRVLDQQGRALVGASVAAHQEDRPVAGAATGRSGEFSLRVPPGEYRLTASFLGYQTRSILIEVPLDAANVEFALSPDVLQQQDVIVESRRAQPLVSPVTYSNLTARELEALPEMKDLPVLLATLPSITFHSENGNGIGYSTLRMRGFDQRRIAVSINGIPQNDPEDFNVFWINFFDIQGAVQDIQVQRGANAAFYGPEGIAGAINIVAMPYTETAYGTLEAGYGTYRTRRLTAEASSGRIGIYSAFARVSRLLTDGYRDNSWAEFVRFFAGIQRATERSTLTLQAYGGPQRDGLAFSGIPREANEVERGEGEIDRRFNASAFTRDSESFHQPHAELIHEWQPREHVTLHQALFGVLGVGYFDFGATFRSPDYLRLPDGWRDLSAEERALPLFLTAPDAEVLFRAYLDQWQIGWLPRITFDHGAGTTSVGLEGRLHRSLRWGRMQEGSGVPVELMGSENDVRVYSFRGEKTIASVFGSHLARPHDRIAVQADLHLTHRRYRVFDEEFFGNEFTTDFLFVNPRLGVTWNPGRPFSLYASAAVANREPRMKDVYDGEEAGAGHQPQFERLDGGALDFSSPLVRPERLYNIELGGRHVGATARLTVNTFLMIFDDEIVPSGGLDQFGVPRTGNAERTRHLGVEVDGEVRFIDGLHALGNLTLSRNRYVRFEEFVAGVGAVSRDGNRIAGVPEQTGYVGLRWTHGIATLNVGTRYSGRQFIDNLNDRAASIDPYALVDASVRLLPRNTLDGLSLRFDLNNVFNARVLTYGNVGPVGPQYFPAATRHLFVGLQYTVR